MKTLNTLALCFVGFAMILFASEEPNPSRLKTQSREKIKVLAEEQPVFMDILLPEEKKGVPVALSSLPVTVTSNATHWIRTVIRSKWLPADIATNMLAFKGVKQWEKKDRKGVVFAERKGDFLVLDYDIACHGIHIQESGVSLSVRIDLPQPMAIADEPLLFIQNYLAEFFNVPGGALSKQNIHFENVMPIYSASCKNATSEDGRATERHWWDDLKVCTDGQFFFLSVPEIEPGSSPRAQPGLPRRF